MAEEQSSKRPRGTESSGGSTRPPEKRLDTTSSIPESITGKRLTVSPTQEFSLSHQHRPWFAGEVTLSPTATESLGRGNESPQSPVTKLQSVTGSDSNRSESTSANAARAHHGGSTDSFFQFVFSANLPFDRDQVIRRSMSKSTLSPMEGASAGNVSPSRAATETSADIPLPEGEYVNARLEHFVEQGDLASPSLQGGHQLVTLVLDTKTYRLEINGGESISEEVGGFEKRLSLETRVVLDHTAFSMIALSSLHQVHEKTKKAGSELLVHIYERETPQGLVLSHHALRNNFDQLVEELESRKLTRIRSVHWWNDKSPMWEVFTVAAGDSAEQSRGVYSPPEYDSTPNDSFAEESQVTLASSPPGSQTPDP